MVSLGQETNLIRQEVIDRRAPDGGVFISSVDEYRIQEYNIMK